jgi:ribonuclease J
MREMWREAGSAEGLEESDMIAGGIAFRAHEVCHSAPGTQAYELLTAQGNVVTSNDLRRHGGRSRATDAFLAHLERNRPRLLILEGTRIGRVGEPIVTERQCAKSIADAIRGAGRRLVVAFVGPNHLERMRAFLDAAEESRRRLVVSPRTMLLIEAIGAADPRYDLRKRDGLAVYDPSADARPKWHRELRERNSSRLVTSQEVRSDPRRFVLCRSHLRNVDLLDVQPKGALLIYSSSAAYSDQARGEHAALGYWAAMFGMRTEGIQFHGSRCEYDPKFNSSGHLSHEDIVEVIDRVRPEILVPVHCEHPEMFKEIAPKDVKVVLPEVGKTIRLS